MYKRGRNAHTHTQAEARPWKGQNYKRGRKHTASCPWCGRNCRHVRNNSSIRVPLSSEQMTMMVMVMMVMMMTRP